ncbi:MAG: hydroxyacylglutathione hydrolase [Deltaproteobacteria bacterium]|nr:hydroxyacylglutathione hydrolase [Deltaproteobacteria bacterium]
MKVVQLTALSDNYTQVIVCPQTNQALFVDAPSADVIMSYVHKTGVEPIAVFNTHHHYDHTAGNQELCQKYPMTVYALRQDGVKIGGDISFVGEGDVISVGVLKLRALAVPGHTAGHLALYGHGALFCGDALFCAGCGCLFEGDYQQLFDSLQKLRGFSDETAVYFGHEYAEENLAFALTLEPDNTEAQKKLKEVRGKNRQDLSRLAATIGDEKKYNPFFRWDAPPMLTGLRHKGVNGLDSPLNVFTAIRELRDDF